MANKLLISELKFNKIILKRNLEGVDDSLSEIEPKTDINSIKWIVQHILTSRIALLRSLDIEAMDELELYEMDIKRLFETFNEIQKSLQTFLTRPEIMDEEKAAMITKYMLHESYHIGQIGLCRRFLGLSGAIS